MSDFTWDYSTEGKRMIFIRDDTGRTFAVIDSALIGAEEGERRANLFGASLDLLEACKTLSQIIRDEFSADGESWDKIKRYQDEVNECLDVIAQAERKAAVA